MVTSRKGNVTGLDGLVTSLKGNVTGSVRVSLSILRELPTGVRAGGAGRCLVRLGFSPVGVIQGRGVELLELSVVHRIEVIHAVCEVLDLATTCVQLSVVINADGVGGDVTAFLCNVQCLDG
ncbi:hypothetical protein LABOLPEG_00001 [Pseudomonas phage phi 21A]|nr:hypothetical protein LABOLPEG_00001 [Pseudomonas phage phi 21A]